jgi:hypothetical protein
MENLDAGWQVAMHATSKLGVASLAIILVGLTATWWGYINRVRWAWFVMFIIAWCWAFPLLVLPLLTHQISYTLVQLLYSAMHQRGFARVSTQSIAIFSLLAIALVLPIKSFFFVTPRKEPIHKASTTLKAVFALVILVVVPGLWAWISFRSYELTPDELNFGQFVPPPPPPQTRRPATK